MEKSKVYYTDMRALPGTNLLKKLEALLDQAGISNIDFNKKFIAIKIHFGEPGNMSYIRPNYAKVVADKVRELGGMPFLTDANTLYVGRRKDALEHMESAYENGYSPFTTGCHIIIADGLKGTDEAYVPVRNGELVKEAKIGQAIMDADIFISLSHFKGHESTGFGGCIKNIGMGCGSRSGKMEMHKAGKPIVKEELCTLCMDCATACAHDAITYEDTAIINHEVCTGCGRCLATCRYNAIYNPDNSANDDLNKKIAEYTMAVVDKRPHFHINLLMDVSPYCDCHSGNDTSIIPDIGMFASFDPVALDQACADEANKAPSMLNSRLTDIMHDDGYVDHHDHFINSMPDTDWKVALEHAEKIGVGSREYELIRIIDPK